METALLTVLALLPALALMFYIYKMDKIEKEPKGLLFGLFGLGCLSVIPAVILELLADIPLNASGLDPESAGYKFWQYFFGVALVEEGCKLFFTYIVIFPIFKTLWYSLLNEIPAKVGDASHFSGLEHYIKMFPPGRRNSFPGVL